MLLVWRGLEGGFSAIARLTAVARACYVHITYVLGVVEEPTVPEVVEATSVVVEEAAVGAVELVQSVDGVLTRVTMNHVQQHCDASPMRLVNQLFQLLWRSIPTTQRTLTMLHISLTCSNIHPRYTDVATCNAYSLYRPIIASNYSCDAVMLTTPQGSRSRPILTKFLVSALA